MTQAISVIKSGLLTTVQDLGRIGYQQYGMVAAGAMDPLALQVGNLLVGNPRGLAALEITLLGPVLRFERPCTIALTGADLSPRLNESPMPMWKRVSVKKGQKLSFGTPREGVRTYLCVQGGIDVPVVMGSRSTYIKGEVGGLHGRALQSEDQLPVGKTDDRHQRPGVRGIQLSRKYRPCYGREIRLRAVPGPQEEAFTDEAVERFFREPYQVTTQSDRMGYRLDGPKLSHRSGADIISDATAPGSVQVPAEGQPIVLTADRQTTGGYAKIATVISADLFRLAQAGPGCQVRFERVSVDEARDAAIEQEQFLRTIEYGIKGK
ncbi:antagonist of KipI [Melghirimyces thermohalophilus]|uniref:Antagonist of KipI n=1 Tax=Melghirimyces thermohalophilus TaxID=1236220 RepID=A0A1G6R5Y2_9BACL|nr:biotin-dependent carboxyltransferase family protein [Melghirimyces thermohalophilus]SDC99958.1 antagonist of KipI [Melghirimyces thermohalophilus]